MKFLDAALESMRTEKGLYREGWNGQPDHVRLAGDGKSILAVFKTQRHVTAAEEFAAIQDGTTVDRTVMVTAPWLRNEADLLKEDWKLTT